MKTAKGFRDHPQWTGACAIRSLTERTRPTLWHTPTWLAGPKIASFTDSALVHAAKTEVELLFAKPIDLSTIPLLREATKESKIESIAD